MCSHFLGKGTSISNIKISDWWYQNLKLQLVLQGSQISYSNIHKHVPRAVFKYEWNCTFRSLPKMELLNRFFYKGFSQIESSYVWKRLLVRTFWKPFQVAVDSITLFYLKYNLKCSCINGMLLRKDFCLCFSFYWRGFLHHPPPSFNDQMPLKTSNIFGRGFLIAIIICIIAEDTRKKD